MRWLPALLACVLAGCASLPTTDPLNVDVAGIDPLPGESLELRLVVPPLWLQPGLYNLRLKLLGSALSAGAARIGSDELALDL